MRNQFFTCANRIISQFNERCSRTRPERMTAELQKAVSMLEGLEDIARYSGDHNAAGFIGTKASTWLRTGVITPFRELV